MKHLRNVLSGVLALLMITGLVGALVVLLRGREQPATVVADPRPTPPEIPAPPTRDPLQAQGVLATLLPVEARSLIQPPAVSKARILYARSAGEPGYYLLDLETGEEIRLAPFPPEQGGGAPGTAMRVSPTGERVLYTLFNNMEPPEHLGIGSVWTMKPDGTDHRKLAGSDELSYPAHAIWSPDGKEIAYLRFPDPLAAAEGKVDAESTELWVMNADGSEQRRVAQLPPIGDTHGTANSIQWLLDDHIYVLTQFTPAGVWLRVNPRTGEVTRLMEGVQIGDVVISPDTRWILAGGVVSEAEIAALGRQPLRLLAASLAWDPKGERVAFTPSPYVYGDGARREPGIWVRDLRTGQEIRLTALDADTANRCSQLAWSPDGSMLLCDAIEGLYVVWVARDVAQMVVSNNPWAQDNVASVDFIGWVPVPGQDEQPGADNGG